MTTPLKFTTFFGDYLLGLWVTWESTPSTDSSGTSDIKIDFQANLRSKLHVYGYSNLPATNTAWPAGVPVDLATDWDTKMDKFIDYFVAGATALPAAGSAFPDAGAETEVYQFYLAWKNPDSSGGVTFDGIQAKAFATISPGIDTTTTDLAKITAAPPTMTVKFQDNTTAAKQFDIHPGNAYAEGANVEDAKLGGKNDVVVTSTAGADLCTEKWQLSLTAIACVEMKGSVKRLRNTGDTTQDIILDYSSKYQMHAMVGRPADNADETLKFLAQEVDFSQFFSGALSSASTSAAVLGAIIYSMAF